MKVSDRALNRLRARTEGLLEPAEIRRIRKTLGLTQEAAGEVTGGGPRAFQRCEAGDLLPSRAISSALALLDRDPGACRAFGAAGGERMSFGGRGGRRSRRFWPTVPHRPSAMTGYCTYDSGGFIGIETFDMIVG
jgi:HTH-type transcriptional regulator/antitoxin MqsA